MQSMQKCFMLIVVICLALLGAACEKSESALPVDPPNDPSNDTFNDTRESIRTIPEQTEINKSIIVNIALDMNESAYRGSMEPLFQAIEKKLSNFAFQYSFVSRNTLKEVMEGPNVPDLIVSAANLRNVDDELIYPLDKEISDVSTIIPSLLSHIKSYDRQERLMGIPLNTQYYALYYNTKAFDYFELEYPDDQLTWSQMIEISRMMVNKASASGNLYVPITLSPEAIYQPFNQLNMTYTNPNTGDVTFTSSVEYIRYLEFIKSFFELPGMKEEYAFSTEMRSSENRLSLPRAMQLSLHFDVQVMNIESEQWQYLDFAPVPVWEELPEVGPSLRPFYAMFIPSRSQHKNEAVSLIKTFISTEIQTFVAENPTGFMAPVLTDPKVHQQFGANMPQYQGKNVAAFFKRTPAQWQSSPWDPFREIDVNFQKFIEFNLDIPKYLDYLHKASEEKIEREKDRQASQKKD